MWNACIIAQPDNLSLRPDLPRSSQHVQNTLFQSQAYLNCCIPHCSLYLSFTESHFHCCLFFSCTPPPTPAPTCGPLISHAWNQQGVMKLEPRGQAKRFYCCSAAAVTLNISHKLPNMNRVTTVLRHGDNEKEGFNFKIAKSKRKIFVNKHSPE